MPNNLSSKIQKSKKLEFTGERLIPEINKGAAFYYEHLARYLFASQIAKDKIILDAGCGVGYGSYILAKYGQGKKVYGVDISKESIDYARSKYFHKKIKYQVDDVEKLKTIAYKSIDLVVSFEVIEHLKNQEKFLEQVKRVLKKDGLFIVSTPNKYTYPKGNPFHTKELYPEEFYQLLNKYFKNVKFYHQGFELAELIKEDGKEEVTLEETFTLSDQQVYSSPLNKKTSQYLLAICSDKALPSIKPISITSAKVDHFDLTRGLLSLGEQFNHLQSQLTTLTTQNIQLSQQLQQKNQEITSLQSQLSQAQTHIQNLEAQLNTIKSAKFFKLWQTYCRARKIIFGR